MYIFLLVLFLPFFALVGFYIGFCTYVTFYDLIHGYGAYYGK